MTVQLRIVSSMISIALLVFSGSATAELAGATPEFESGETRPVTIALLPAVATVTKARLIKSEALVEEGNEFSGVFSAKIIELLSAQGYDVDFISPSRIDDDPQLREYVIDANRRFDEVAGAFVRPKRVKRREYSVGDEARILANYLQVDAVVFPRLSIVAATGGRKAMAWTLGGTAGGSSGALSIIDGVSGDLEARFVGRGSGSSNKFDEDPSGEIVEISTAMLEDLPGADANLRVVRDASGDDVISELEALLDD